MIVPLNPAYVGFQETKNTCLTTSFLKDLLGNRNFEWNYLPTNGILAAMDADIFSVVSWDIGNFYIVVVVRDKFSNVTSRITTV